jgi:hypothetical protein
MPSPSRKSAASRIEAAQAAFTETNSRLAELTEQRDAALLDDDTAAAMKLGVEIANRTLEARAYGDKIRLLREEAAREEQARREKERAAQIGKIEAKIDQRDKAMDEVAAAIKQLATASERAINLNREVIAAWTWHAHDLPAALLTPPAIMAAISHEAYRLSYHPRRYGGMDTDPLAGVMLPGSRCPRLEWMELPEKTKPLLEVVRDASEFAKRFLRTGKGSAAVDVASQPGTSSAAPMPTMNGGEPVQRSEAEQRLAGLLKQQLELAEDVTPAGEKAYALIVSEIARVQAEIDAARKMEMQGHG